MLYIDTGHGWDHAGAHLQIRRQGLDILDISTGVLSNNFKL